MPRDLPIGNGSLLVAFDAQYRIADFYFPRVGMENHAAGKSRFGVFCDGELHPVDEAPWQRTLEYLRDTLVTDVQLQNDAIGLRLRCYDAVDPDSCVFVRRIVVRNLRDEARDVKLFLHHELAMYGTTIGDTVMFDPLSRGIVQYKSRRYVLINCDGGVSEYACGRSQAAGWDGTWIDAQDGALSMQAIAQGGVDSTFSIPLHLEANGSATTFYWICAGRTDAEVRKLDAQVREEGVARLLARTGSHWYTWVNKPGIDVTDLPDEIADLYRRSLLVIATQCDRGGAVLAANDSDITWGHNDHYSYVWTRDAAFVCDAMDRAGFPEITRRFLLFANEIIRDEGYFLHKYNPDGSPAPLWHPWVANGELQLPIQEDETALVIWLVARHYERTRDLDLLRTIYKRLVVSAADFLVRFRDRETLLPSPSLDLWEERFGTFTFTSAAVWAGLTAAAELANLFNEQERRATYTAAAAEVRDAMKKHLWLEEEARFARGFVRGDDGALTLDPTVDSSAFAAFYLGVFPSSSAMIEGTMRAIREKLWVRTDTGGAARYENDAYHRISEELERVPGNPWILCTLWLAEHVIAKATNVEGLQRALDLVRWARAKATPSMILPEQVDPYNGQALSVAPLTWSHAQVISIVHGYLDALRRLRQIH
ncbi:MAG TPA: glycoside hydrolase family 15 protein [Thermoanaerobaculia bacterium]|nr:glycoside hydrolase family 15 protein [Thermoanaerobaculia bacterium]